MLTRFKTANPFLIVSKIASGAIYGVDDSKFQIPNLTGYEFGFVLDLFQCKIASPVPSTGCGGFRLE